MKGSDAKEIDRYYRKYQRLVGLSLAFSVCLGTYFLLYVLEYIDDPGATGGLIIGALYVAGFVALKIDASGARHWGRHDPFIRAVFGDEWSRATRNRASRAALTVTLFGQAPLMMIMAHAPARHSALGMGAMTLTLGLSAFFGAYLYYGRQPSDG